MRQIFLDTETTGLEADKGDRIIEIGCVELVHRQPTGRNWHRYLNPERPSNPEAVKVHGLTDDFLADKPLFAHVAGELVDYLSGAELVIHNAAFDIGFLDAEFARLGLAPLSAVAGRIVDTLLMARERYPGKANSLDALCRRLEVDNSSRTLHGALLDAGLLAEVYIRMTRGQGSLVIDAADQGPAQHELAAVDFAALELPVIEPTMTELAAHRITLAELDKVCNGRALWREPVA